jgi:hypothetical protein
MHSAQAASRRGPSQAWTRTPTWYSLQEVIGKPGAAVPPVCTISSFTACRSSASLTLAGRLPTLQGGGGQGQGNGGASRGKGEGSAQLQTWRHLGNQAHCCVCAAL